jgi:hypothetical protein
VLLALEVVVVVVVVVAAAAAAVEEEEEEEECNPLIVEQFPFSDSPNPHAVISAEKRSLPFLNVFATMWQGEHLWKSESGTE